MRPIPPEITMAETCFVEEWSLARARKFAEEHELVGVEEEPYDPDGDGLITFTFYEDHSAVHYCKDTGRIFGIQLTYDVNVFVKSDRLGKLDFPQ
jgi:hypothetical protein